MRINSRITFCSSYRGSSWSHAPPLAQACVASAFAEPAKRASVGMARCTSQRSMGSASGLSADMPADGETEEYKGEYDAPPPLCERAVRGASRSIRAPYLLRGDVGILGVMCGNWGGEL